VTPVTEKRLLQAVILIACLVPLTAGPTGIWRGAAWMAHGAPVSADLDSQFRYMSGIFTGVGLAFLSCVPGIESKSARLRLLVAFVVLGGLSRTLSYVQMGMPDVGNRFGLVMELVVTPLIALWQWRFARRWANTPYRG
jgi:Domain of unknown function (DUF4345)